MRRFLVGAMTAVFMAIAADAMARPTLTVNKWGFCVHEPGWRISVYGAEPNSPVLLKEWYGFRGQTMNLVWDGYLGTTDGNGNFFYETGAPSFVNNFVAQVTINGDRSNLISYGTSNC